LFALVLESKSSPFIIKDVATPPIGDDDVLVNIKAAAFNHRDYFIQQGLYPRTTFPIIIGSDGAGVVVEVGKNVLPSLIGAEVVINPSLNWGSNPKFASRDYKILGFPDQGTFAEYVAVPARLVHPKPRHLSWEESAALPLTAMTAFRAVSTKGNVQRGENVLITGIGGGVALSAMQFALAAGAKVFVTSGSDEKIHNALALGAQGGVNYRNDRWASELIQLAPSFDLIIDGSVGDGFAKLLDIASFGGRIVVYGSTQGKSPNTEPARIFWKQLSILGTTMATDEEFVAMLAFVERHAIKPVVDSVFPFENANEALARMARGEQFGKIVITSSTF
jgi:NADPH:quinone reductase-like Zn-dependent oxidoreductase